MHPFDTQKKEHGLTPPLGWCKKAAARYSLYTGNLRGDGLAGNILYLFQSGVCEILKDHIPGDSFPQIEELVAEGKIYPLRNTARVLDEGDKSTALPIKIAYDRGFEEGCRSAEKAQSKKHFHTNVKMTVAAMAMMVAGAMIYSCFFENKGQIGKGNAAKSSSVVAPR